MRPVKQAAAGICVACLIAVRGVLAADDGRNSLPRLPALVLSDVGGQALPVVGPAAPKLTVLIFLGTECPVSNGYAPALARLDAAQRGQGVKLIGVHCDPDVTAEAAKGHAAEYRLEFPLALDHRQELAGRLGVEVVPTAVVIAQDGRVLYRGRIDNRYVQSGVRRPQATVFDLEAALDAALAGKEPTPATTEPFGCPLPPPRRD